MKSLIPSSQKNAQLKVKSHNLTSLLIFILASIILFASVMVTIAGLIKYGENGWRFEAGTGPCDR
jgi:hypothetical protein